MQDQIDYLMEFIDILDEILEEKTGQRQPELSVEQKKRLAYRGRKLNEFLLGQIEKTFAPSTILKWYSELIANKYNSTGKNQKRLSTLTACIEREEQETSPPIRLSAVQIQFDFGDI